MESVGMEGRGMQGAVLQAIFPRPAGSLLEPAGALAHPFQSDLAEPRKPQAFLGGRRSS